MSRSPPALPLAAVLLLAVAAPAAAAPPDTEASDTTTASERLRAALEAHRLPLELEDGDLRGPGAELLVEGAGRARYLLVGETHGVAEAPRLIAALYRRLRPAGYHHLAVEIGPVQAEKIGDVLAGRDPMGAYRRFLGEHWPGVPFYAWREEAGLLAEVVRLDGADALWGIDYDILGGRYPLHRLRELAPDAGARAAADRLVSRADSLLERATEDGEPSTIMMFSQPVAVWDSLRRSYGPAPGSEADRILDQLAATARINEAWTAGRRWRSNRLRVALLKHNLLARLRGTAPDAKVVVKMGGYHVTRGRTPNNTFDVGNLLSELSIVEAARRAAGDGTAEASADEALRRTGSRSFHVLVVGGPGRKRGALDPGTWGVRPAPTVLSQEDHWARPLAETTLQDRWSVFDLRPLRSRTDAGDFGELPPRLEETIFGYDAVVVLAGSTPARTLPVEGRGR